MGHACLNGRPPRVWQWAYIIDLWSDDSMDVRLQLIYSHSSKCTRVPWESLTLMVISLALVNGLHHWSVIKWFLPCSTSKNLFTWLDLYYIGISKKTLGWFFILICTFPRLWRSSFELWHIFCYIVPLCIGRGYVLSSHRSTMFSLWIRSIQVIGV